MPTSLIRACDERNVIGGDFNFVETESDCSGSAENACLTGKAERRWKQVCELLKLEEVTQDAHTRFARGRYPSSSRLDRFYVTSTPAEQAVTVLRTYLPRISCTPEEERPETGSTWATGLRRARPSR